MSDICDEKILWFQRFLKNVLYLVRYIKLVVVLDDTPVPGDLPVRVRVLAQLGQHAGETEHPQRVPSGHPLHHRVGKQHGYPNCAQYTTVQYSSTCLMALYPHGTRKAYVNHTRP
jgi:hypothetical protein